MKYRAPRKFTPWGFALFLPLLPRRTSFFEDKMRVFALEIGRKVRFFLL